MASIGEVISRQTGIILENRRQTLVLAVLLSLIPFAAWLSVSLVALVTLRKGVKAGFELMCPAFIVHTIPFLWFVSAEAAFINTALAYVPCFLAASILRRTGSWQYASGLLFLQAMLGIFLIDYCLPGFVTHQFEAFKQLLSQHEAYQSVMENKASLFRPLIGAHLFIGFQMLSIGVSAVLSLMCARMMQAKLFMPGGFRKELMDFRSGRIALAIFLALVIASYYELGLAIDLLPLGLCYCLASGFSLLSCLTTGRRQLSVWGLLLLLFLLKPTLVLLVFIVFGSLDCVFNFRLYLLSGVRKSI